jgi:hypothetical protein
MRNPLRMFLVAGLTLLLGGAAGDYLLKMLYNEREMPFKTACQSSRDGSHYYRFDDLKRCYGYE